MYTDFKLYHVKQVKETKELKGGIFDRLLAFKTSDFKHVKIQLFETMHATLPLVSEIPRN